VVDDGKHCVEAGAFTVAGRHDSSDPWDDKPVPAEQPRQKELRKDNKHDGINELSGYGLSDDYDATLDGDVHVAPAVMGSN